MPLDAPALPMTRRGVACEVRSAVRCMGLLSRRTAAAAHNDLSCYMKRSMAIPETRP
jgi:hypothetical protein